MFHGRTLGRLGLWEILVKRIFILCARVKSTWLLFRVFQISQKRWVKMVKLFDFYGILWYFEKGLMGSLWVDLGHR